MMNILSILTHDATTAFISDGKLKYFAKEERLSKEKHDKGCTKCLLYHKNNFKVDLAILNSTTIPNPLYEQFLDQSENNLIVK